MLHRVAINDDHVIVQNTHTFDVFVRNDEKKNFVGSLIRRYEGQQWVFGCDPKRQLCMHYTPYLTDVFQVSVGDSATSFSIKNKSDVMGAGFDFKSQCLLAAQKNLDLFDPGFRLIQSIPQISQYEPNKKVVYCPEISCFLIHLKDSLEIYDPRMNEMVFSLPNLLHHAHDLDRHYGIFSLLLWKNRQKVIRADLRFLQKNTTKKTLIHTVEISVSHDQHFVTFAHRNSACAYPLIAVKEPGYQNWDDFDDRLIVELNASSDWKETLIESDTPVKRHCN